MGEDLKYAWYKYSEKFIPDKYKPSQVHASNNRKLIESWYNECIKIKLLPKEFMTNPVIQKTKIRTKSFHKQRKEEWKRRQSKKKKETIDEQERKEECPC